MVPLMTRIKKLHKFVKRIMDANTERQGEFLQKKLVQLLRKKQQSTAAIWFQEYWTGRRGRWTSTHAWHVNVRTNSSLEGHIGQCKENWLVAGYRNCSQNLTEFTGSVVEDVKQRSIEHHITLRHCLVSKILGSNP